MHEYIEEPIMLFNEEVHLLSWVIIEKLEKNCYYYYHYDYCEQEFYMRRNNYTYSYIINFTW